MNKEINNACNEQIQAEMYSAYLYLAMAAFLESEDMGGAASWMKYQAFEEMEHAMKFYDYVFQLGGVVELLEIEKPPSKFGTLLEVFQGALEHEKIVTGRINSLYEMALEKKDYPFQMFLQWFINEQVEEESTANEIISKIKAVGDSKEALYMLDQELGTRAPDEEETK